MAAVMWIEVLGRDGEVVARERIDTPEARIGRAFDNDMVLDDPHVAPHHLRVLRGEDGALVAEDLGTKNGLYAEHGAERVVRLGLALDPGLRIGRTTLRVHDASRPVASESKAPAFTRLSNTRLFTRRRSRVSHSACSEVILPSAARAPPRRGAAPRSGRRR